MHMNLQHMRFDKSNFLCFLKKKGTSSPASDSVCGHQEAQIGSDWQIWQRWMNFPSFCLVTFHRDRHFFSDVIELTEMQHFSFYKFKKQPASICLGIWDQIVKVVRWLQNKSSVELSSEYHVVQSCDFYSSTGNSFFSLIQVSYPKWLSICMFNCS
jgi:hypothetical protein